MNLHDLGTIHVLRGVLALVAFSNAFIIATALSISRGSPLFGRMLLVMFSFGVVLAQVALWNAPVTWNVFFTYVTVFVECWYIRLMLRELRDRGHM